MVASHIQIELSEPARRFIAAQCAAGDRQSMSEYTLELIERERIDCALEEGLESSFGAFDDAEIDAIKRRIAESK